MMQTSLPLYHSSFVLPLFHIFVAMFTGYLTRCDQGTYDGAVAQWTHLSHTKLLNYKSFQERGIFASVGLYQSQHKRNSPGMGSRCDITENVHAMRNGKFTPPEPQEEALEPKALMNAATLITAPA